MGRVSMFNQPYVATTKLTLEEGQSSLGPQPGRLATAPGYRARSRLSASVRAATLYAVSSSNYYFWRPSG